MNDTSTPAAPPPQTDIKTKAKKPQTEKQKENFQKALAALKIKREAQKKAQEEETEMLKAEKDEVKLQRKQAEYYEKAKLQKKTRGPKPMYVTAAELERVKLELLEHLAPKQIVREREVEVEKVVEKAKPVVIEKVVEKPTTKVLSGNELLDRIFFTK